MPLSAQDQLAINAASPKPIINALARFALPQSHGAWISPTNNHRNGELPRNWQTFQAVDPNEVIEAVSVRGPIHAIDGWGYLARAMSALVAGDAHGARHLAYYAELRAAMSILASTGIGIFDKIHVVIDDNNNIKRLTQSGTHMMCWDVLEHWSTRGNSLELMLSSVQIGGVSLAEIFKQIYNGATGSSVGSRIIQDWGFDLQQVAQDRNERNFSSYQLNVLTDIQTTIDSDLDVIESIWKAFEPEGVVLERHMLRILLELQEKALRTGGGRAGAIVALKGRTSEYASLDQRVQKLVSMDFLLRRTEGQDHDIIAIARRQTNPARAEEMICRAALLLHVATAMTKENLQRAAVDKGEAFSWWWEEFVAERGFWDTQREDGFSLWDDVALALEDAKNTEKNTRYEWLRGLNRPVHQICQAERIALWNICE